MEKYLVVNGGSSSLKFSLYELNENSEKEIISGVVERIGQEVGNIVIKEKNKIEEKVIVKTHTDAVNVMLKKLLELNYLENIEEIKGIGHRVLHGGEFYSDSVIIDEESLNNIKSLTPFGPLHLPGEISVIESMMETLPHVPNVAVFDTAFHQTIPEYNYLYALPNEYYKEYGIRKYGFHGTSHKYVAERMKEILKDNDEIKIINCHVGNGSSAAAIKNEQCINTTMGFTPVEGLIMGTRSGSIDPSIIEYICKIKNITVEECMNILNKKSGLLGISEVSSDFRDLEAAKNQGNKKATLAIEMLEKSITKYIAQYLAELNYDVDGIVFTAGIGENIPSLRKNIIENFKGLGIKIDDEINENMKFGREGKISSDDSTINVYVIPTNEEIMILKDTVRIIKENKNIKIKKLSK